jgi:hypothetical protein
MRGKYVFGTLGIAAICSSAGMRAAPSAKQYGQIPARNLFGLHEPVQPTNEPVKPQLPKVSLSGISTINNKLAFLKLQPLSKPGEQPQSEQSLMLTEGQREAGIEVLEINEKAGTIRINNVGTEMTIGFDKDAGKVASGPPPGSGPGPAGAPPNIGAKIRAMHPGVSGYQRMIPTRNGGQVPAQAEPPPPSAQTPAQPLIQQPNAPTEKPLTPEEQAVLKDLEQAAQGVQTQPR